MANGRGIIEEEEGRRAGRMVSDPFSQASVFAAGAAGAPIIPSPREAAQPSERWKPPGMPVAEPSPFPIRIGYPAVDDLSREVVDRVLGYESDYATRGPEELGPGKGRFQLQREPQPVVAPRSSLESVWGITQETLPTGATKYTLPGTEGTMTAEPRADYLGRLAAAGTTEEEQKKSYLDRLGREEEERYRGVVAETTYREQVERAKRTQAETDARMEEQILQELAGLRPRTGIRELGAVERWGKKTPAEEKARAEALGETQKAYITGRASREAAGIQAEGVVSAAGMKAQTEAARLGIQAAGVKSTMELNRARIDDMLARTGLLEPTKLKLQAAKNADDRRKIMLESAEAASKDIYEKEMKALENQLNLGFISPPDYQVAVARQTKARAERYNIISDENPFEGRVHSSGTMVFRNGVWVDLPGKGKKE